MRAVGAVSVRDALDGAVTAIGAGGSASARSYRRARSTRSAFSRFCSWDFSSCMETTMPDGRCVSRTAESVVLTDCPPGPEER